MKKRKGKLILISFVAVLTIGYLVYTGIRDTMLYYLTVTEVIENGALASTGGIRVGGKVLEGTVKWNPRDLSLKFIIGDEKNTIPVLYQGVVPDSFKQGQKAIVEGVYMDGVLKATQIMPTCPSKYE
jgi:cytochrome c-type biogenesis protein CcmE